MSAKAGFTRLCEAAWASNIGAYAVCMFFCISGYLIVSTLNRHRSIRRFARNRCLRIYPLFLILHLVMFFVGPFMNYEWMGSIRHDSWAYLRHYFSNALLLPGVFNFPIAQKNAWSLSCEAAFYLLVGTIFVGRQRLDSRSGRLMWGLGWFACVEACWVEPNFLFFAAGVLVWWLE